MRGPGAAAVSLAALISGVAQSQTSGYFLDRMPTIKGASFTPTGINDSGYIVGDASTGSLVTPQLVKNGIPQALKGLGGNCAIVNNWLTVSAVSNSGAAAGTGYNASSLYRAVYWDTSGTPWELVPPQSLPDNVNQYDFRYTTAVDIDEHGDTVGIAGCNGDDICPVIWHGGYTSGAVGLAKVFIPDGPPELETPTAISRNGEWVAGYALPDRSSGFAEIWHNGIPSIVASYADGYGVNDSGTMVGDMGVGPDTCPNNPFAIECLTYVAAMWGPHSVKLALLPGTTTSVARAINNSNIVVGTNGGHAVKWDTAGRVTDLSKLMAAQLPGGTVLADALKITDGGKILVEAATSSGGSQYSNSLRPSRIRSRFPRTSIQRATGSRSIWSRASFPRKRLPYRRGMCSGTTMGSCWVRRD